MLNRCDFHLIALSLVLRSIPSLTLDCCCMNIDILIRMCGSDAMSRETLMTSSVHVPFEGLSNCSWFFESKFEWECEVNERFFHTIVTSNHQTLPRSFIPMSRSFCDQNKCIAFVGVHKSLPRQLAPKQSG